MLSPLQVLPEVEHLRPQIYQNLLRLFAMKNDDQYIQELISLACSKKRRERQAAFSELQAEIWKSLKPGLLQNPDYADAAVDSFAWLRKKLPEFEMEPPNKRERLLRWFTTHLWYQLRQSLRKRYQQQGREISLDAAVAPESDSSLLDLLGEDGQIYRQERAIDGLQAWIAQKQKQELRQVLQAWLAYIEADPEGRLQAKYCVSPEYNCQRLARDYKLAQDEKVKLSQIAKQYDVKYQTLNSLWKRSCLPLLAELLRDRSEKLGYDLDALLELNELKIILKKWEK